MIRARHALLILALLAGPLAGAGQEHATLPVLQVDQPGQVFAEAGAAYDGGRYAEAAALYRHLLLAGHATKEVHFNLGNALFRSGDLGVAVLNYRRAWYQAPRDEDIRTNLGFALDHTGAEFPPLTPAARLLRRLTRPEWTVLATAAWWMLAGLVITAVGLPGSRRMARRGIGLVILLLVVSLTGIWHWERLAASGEMVVVRRDQVARYAPLTEAGTHFELPPGSIVTRLERSGDWLRVGTGPRNGWIPAASCRAVHPDL